MSAAEPRAALVPTGDAKKRLSLSRECREVIYGQSQPLLLCSCGYILHQAALAVL